MPKFRDTQTVKATQLWQCYFKAMYSIYCRGFYHHTYTIYSFLVTLPSDLTKIYSSFHFVYVTTVNDAANKIQMIISSPIQSSMYQDIVADNWSSNEIQTLISSPIQSSIRIQLLLTGLVTRNRYTDAHIKSYPVYSSIRTQLIPSGPVTRCICSYQVLSSLVSGYCCG